MTYSLGISGRETDLGSSAPYVQVEKENTLPYVTNRGTVVNMAAGGGGGGGAPGIIDKILAVAATSATLGGSVILAGTGITILLNDRGTLYWTLGKPLADMLGWGGIAASIPVAYAAYKAIEHLRNVF